MAPKALKYEHSTKSSKTKCLDCCTWIHCIGSNCGTLVYDSENPKYQLISSSDTISINHNNLLSFDKVSQYCIVKSSTNTEKIITFNL